jgi:hypothetical protein
LFTFALNQIYMEECRLIPCILICIHWFLILRFVVGSVVRPANRPYSFLWLLFVAFVPFYGYYTYYRKYIAVNETEDEDEIE